VCRTTARNLRSLLSRLETALGQPLIPSLRRVFLHNSPLPCDGRKVSSPVAGYALSNSRPNCPELVPTCNRIGYIRGLMDASVRELKPRLSHYLKLAARGEQVIVTSRGRPIARLLPAAPKATKKEPSPAEINRRLAAIPGVILPTGPKPRSSSHPIRIRKGEKTLAEIVLEDRGQRLRARDSWALRAGYLSPLVGRGRAAFFCCAGERPLGIGAAASGMHAPSQTIELEYRFLLLGKRVWTIRSKYKGTSRSELGRYRLSFGPSPGASRRPLPTGRGKKSAAQRSIDDGIANACAIRNAARRELIMFQ
jgi:prevent-host-death family protein